MQPININRPKAAEITLHAQEKYFAGEVEAALKLYVEAWSLCQDAIGAMNIAIAFEHLGDFENALEWSERAYQMRPEDWRTRTCYGGNLIREGRWEEAWQHWFPVIEKPFDGAGVEWKPGMDLTGKEVLVVPAGGYGDVFMLARYIPEVAKRFNCNVSFAPTEDMVPVFITQPSMANVNIREHRTWGVWMHLFHFPQLFQFTPEMVAADWKPYIEPVSLEGWEQDDIRVGIKLGAGEKGDLFKFRSVPGIIGEELISGIEKRVTLVALTQSNPLVNNWLDTIALISSCDLILSVDTATLHLAAAMGKETWAILGDFNDPKYGKGDTMPWYPTMRVFRGKGSGYKHTVDQVLEAMGVWLLNSRRQSCRVATM